MIGIFVTHSIAATKIKTYRGGTRDTEKTRINFTAEAGRKPKPRSGRSRRKTNIWKSFQERDFGRRKQEL